MPNHVHCIITLGGLDYDNGVATERMDDNPGGCGCVDKIHEFYLPYNPTHPVTIKQYRAIRRKMLIPKIFGKFQMQTSKQMNIIRGTIGQSNWQRDYHDHIIRDDAEFQLIRQYIINNPAKWEKDRFNTAE
jgi:putative transposase